MPELLAIQRDMAHALRKRESTHSAEQWLAGGPALVERRLAIYRANVAAALAKALSAAYPVLRRVVGDEDFDALACAFQRLVPSTSGDLHDYGVEFAGFLAQSPLARSLPYLPDLARLEWAAHRAYGANDAEPWDPAGLGQVEPSRLATIRLLWADGTAVIASTFPLARIWQIHQPEHDGEFTVDWNAAPPALVAREGLRVTVSTLDTGDAAFIIASLAGATLGASVEAALTADPAFDLGRLLARAAARNLVRGFILDERQAA